MAVDGQKTVTQIPLDIRKVAWVIMFGSFMLFCTSSVALTAGVYFVLFQSTEPMDTIVQVGRGTVVIQDEFQQRAPRSGRNYLANLPAAVSTDAQTQAVINFLLDDDQSRALATITLKNDAEVTINQAQQPRFGWSNGQYFVDLRAIRGRFEVFINRVENRSFRIQVHTLDDALILLDTPGRYSLTLDDSSVRLASQHGIAAFLTADRQNNRLVTSGQEAILLAGRDAPVLTPGPRNLLDNSLFSFELSEGQSGITLPTLWQCSNPSDDLPRGRYTSDVWAGRLGLRFLRAEGASSHGETTCEQSVAFEQRDVSGYSYLELRTTFLLNYQSLSECGVEGSECPMMLYMRYVDVGGNVREWYKGFYYSANPQSDYPIRCASCAETHDQINEKTWYTYETGNLMALLPEDERPQRIETVRFYASGHQYDVFISDIALLAGVREIVPPNENLTPLNSDAG